MRLFKARKSVDSNANTTSTATETPIDPLNENVSNNNLSNCVQHNHQLPYNNNHQITTTTTMTNVNNDICVNNVNDSPVNVHENGATTAATVTTTKTTSENHINNNNCNKSVSSSVSSYNAPTTAVNNNNNHDLIDNNNKKFTLLNNNHNSNTKYDIRRKSMIETSSTIKLLESTCDTLGMSNLPLAAMQQQNGKCSPCFRKSYF